MTAPRKNRWHDQAFTLIEILTAISVLSLLIVLVSQLITHATSITAMGNKHMDADMQARTVMDRMAIDFSHIVKHSDVDYYLKEASSIIQDGNDQIAFYSEVPGYYPSTTSHSPVSLVAYRIVSTPYRLERMGKGLLWNGASTDQTPMRYKPYTIASTWPTATNAATDDDYEDIGPQVFRFEYYYILNGIAKSGTTAATSATTSITPWNSTHTEVNGLKDVGAIVVTIAVIDEKSRKLVSEAQLQSLIGTMDNFPTTKAENLVTQWQNAIDSSSLPRAAISGVRIYTRTFPITPYFE
ncbi:MAG: type II secretion system protein J [Chthoniobacteraceae bacterium]